MGFALAHGRPCLTATTLGRQHAPIDKLPARRSSECPALDSIMSASCRSSRPRPECSRNGGTPTPELPTSPRRPGPVRRRFCTGSTVRTACSPKRWSYVSRSFTNGSPPTPTRCPRPRNGCDCWSTRCSTSTTGVCGWSCACSPCATSAPRRSVTGWIVAGGRGYAPRSRWANRPVNSSTAMRARSHSCWPACSTGSPRCWPCEPPGSAPSRSSPPG